jgi:hypothetical protein
MTDESCSGGMCTSTTVSASSTGLPPQRKQRRRPLSAGAARFIELTRLPIGRTDDALGETSSGASTTSRIAYASWLLSEGNAS